MQHTYNICIERKIILDRRTVYTRMVIKEAFIKFLSTKPLSEITIKEICLEANINRATFYRNYEDLYHLFEEIENELIQEAFPNGTDSYDISQLLEVIYHNQVFYREFFNNHLQSSFIETMINEMKLSFANTLIDNGCEPPPKEFSELLLKMCYKLFSL